MGDQHRREREAATTRLFESGEVSPLHCRGCGLLLDDFTMLYCDTCTPPPIKCGACLHTVTGRLADHFCRPAHGMPSECERIQAANEAAYQRTLREAVEL